MKPIAQYRKHTREQDKNLDKALHFILKARKNMRQMSESVRRLQVI